MNKSMNDIKKFDIEEVRKVVAQESDAQFGAMIGVETSFHNGMYKVLIKKDNFFDRIEVTIDLQTDLYGKEATSYYINYSSRWASAQYASELATLMGGCSAIAYKLEEMGLPYRA